MFCLNKRQCHSVILFSVLHIYTGDAEQRRLRCEATDGYTGMHAADTDTDWWARTADVMNTVGRTRLVPSSVAPTTLQATQSYCFLMQSLTAKLNPEIYAIIHAISSVLSAVRMPWRKEEKTRLMHLWRYNERDDKLKTQVFRWTWCDTMMSRYWEWNDE